MKKIMSLILFLSFFFPGTAQVKSIYNFKTTTIDGNVFDFSTLRSKKILIVNTASKCGFTPQYKSNQNKPNR